MSTRTSFFPKTVSNSELNSMPMAAAPGAAECFRPSGSQRPAPPRPAELELCSPFSGRSAPASSAGPVSLPRRAMAAKRPRTDAASADTGTEAPRVPCIVSAGADLTAVAMALTGGSARAGHGLAASTVEGGGVSSSAAAAGGAVSDSGSSSSSSAAAAGAEHATVLRATKPGILRFRAPDRVWVETTHRRYVPAVGDTVVGVVLERRAEAYRVDVGGSTAAFLPLLAFDGASRRNKPDLPVGCMVYARVCGVDRHADAELTCQVADGPKRDWVTGESVFGELRGGTCVRLGVAFAKT